MVIGARLNFSLAPLQAISGVLLHRTPPHISWLGMSSEHLAPHVKYSLAKYVDKGEDAWTQQPELSCTLPGSDGTAVRSAQRHLMLLWMHAPTRGGRFRRWQTPNPTRSWC